MAHWEPERWARRKRRLRCSVFLPLFPLSFSLRSWAPFVFFTSVPILCSEPFISLSVSCFSSSQQGNTDAEPIQGERGRWRKRRTTSIFESFLPAVTSPYLHRTVLNAVQSLSSACHLGCDLALLGKGTFAIGTRVVVPSELDPWHPPRPPTVFCYGQRQQLPQQVGGLWLGRNIPVPALHRRGHFLDRRIQCHHSNRVARKRRAGVHHCPATGAAQRHQHPDCQPVVLGHPHVCSVSPCYCHIHTDGPLGAGRGPVQG